MLATLEQLKSGQKQIAVIGLGYVGLPLAALLAKHFSVVGYDIDPERIKALKDGRDHTGEVDSKDIFNENLQFTSIRDHLSLSQAAVYIVCVPTPVDPFKVPDLTPLQMACQMIRTVASLDEKLVIFESTVFPGTVEGFLDSWLDRIIGGRIQLGYSPERVNPGDPEHSIDKVTKIISAETDEGLELMAAIYGAITPRLHRAPSIQVAEAAKVIENIQRDVNIALINELAQLFDRLGIRTRDVLEAAGTKWNWQHYVPGLVGGHCIGVDPYYLAHLARSVDFDTRMILAGRQVNDGMAEFVANKCIELILQQGTLPKRVERCSVGHDCFRVGLFGLTFKENVPDFRNSQAYKVANILGNKGVDVFQYDPDEDLIDPSTCEEFDAIIIAVAHDEYRAIPINKVQSNIVLDLKGIYSPGDAEACGKVLWQL